MRLAMSLALAALVLFAVPTTVRAEDVLKPTKAQSALRKALKKIRGDAAKADEEKRYATEYLAKWKASGKKPTAADGYALAQFHQSAGERAKAAGLFRGVRVNEDAKEKTRDYAATAEALLLLMPDVRTALGKDGLAKSIKELSGWAADQAASPMRSKNRTKLLKVLASVHAMGGDSAAAHDLRMEIITQDPGSLGELVRPIMQGMLGSTCALADFDALRTKAGTVLKTIAGVQAGIVKEKKTKLDKAVAKLKGSDASAFGSDGRLKKTSTRGMSADEKAVYTAQRSYDSADKLLQGLAANSAPFERLGKAAEDWTLTKGYGEVTTLAYLKGKVVLLDCWATWADQNNFPVVRDLVRDFGEKGLAVVGLTSSASVVYASRYDADPDMAAKLEKGARLYYAARLANEKSPADEDKAIYDSKEYREIEMQAIAQFKENHELPWPLALIDDTEPEEKYGAAGLPHLLLLDKEGRVRLIRSGMVSRDKTALVASLRKAIETLLAE